MLLSARAILLVTLSCFLEFAKALFEVEILDDLELHFTYKRVRIDARAAAVKKRPRSALVFTPGATRSRREV
jgi:hypothetical protein